MRVRIPFARTAPMATVRKTTKARTIAPTLYLSAQPRRSPEPFDRDLSEEGKRFEAAQGATRVQTPWPACVSRPALTRRSTMRVAASGDTCSELRNPSIVTKGAPPWTISSRTVLTTSARRVVSRRFTSTRPRYARGVGDGGCGTGTRTSPRSATRRSNRSGRLRANR
jgi:hypothetical protein